MFGSAYSSVATCRRSKVNKRFQTLSSQRKLLALCALFAMSWTVYYCIDALNLLNNLHYTGYPEAALAVKAALDAANIPFFLTQSSALLAHRERTFKKYKQNHGRANFDIDIGIFNASFDVEKVTQALVQHGGGGVFKLTMSKNKWATTHEKGAWELHFDHVPSNVSIDVYEYVVSDEALALTKPFYMRQGAPPSRQEAGSWGWFATHRSKLFASGVCRNHFDAFTPALCPDSFELSDAGFHCVPESFLGHRYGCTRAGWRTPDAYSYYDAVKEGKFCSMLPDPLSRKKAWPMR